MPQPTLGAVLASKVGENMCIYIHTHVYIYIYTHMYICLIYILYIYTLGKVGATARLAANSRLARLLGRIYHLSDFGKLAYFGSEVGFAKSPSQDYTGSQVIS